MRRKILTATFHKKESGFALLSVAILLGIVLTFGLSFIDYVVMSRQAGKKLRSALSAGQIAEAGLNQAVFCMNAASGINCGGTYGVNYAGETDVDFGGGKFTVVMSGNGSMRTVLSTGTAADGQTARIAVDLTPSPQSDGAQFNYALQSGTNGVRIENNAGVSGTIYSNGNIDCQSNNAVITGDAYAALADGRIDKCKVVFDAHADKIIGAKVQRDAYYKNDPMDLAGTTVSGVKYPDSETPAPAPLPTINVDFWRQAAENGGVINGNFSPPDNSSLGPKKIIGDLILEQNVDVTITGPLWVLGDITTQNNSSFTLGPSFGAYSTVILADDPGDQLNNGRITIVNNTAINGSGNPQSHMLLASTNTSMSDSDPAMSIANNASGAVFYALNGSLRLQNGAGAKSLAAERLFLDQNAVVTYLQSEFTGQFSSSPGGTWRINAGSWREIKQ